MTEKEVRSLFVQTFEELKELQETLASVMDQVAALRDALKEVPGFSRAFSARLEY